MKGKRSSRYDLLIKEMMSEIEGCVDAYRAYLSFRPDTMQKVCGETAERLYEHMVNVVSVILSLEDHRAVISRLVRKLHRGLVKGESYDLIANILLYFVTLYHDIGKAELHYQLYAHRKLDRPVIPHNLASVAYLVYASTRGDWYTKWLQLFVERFGFDPGIAKDLFMAATTAIALHHEYFDYVDGGLSLIDVITPMTIAYAKNVDLSLVLHFHKTASDVLNEAWKNIEKLSVLSQIKEYAADLLYTPKNNIEIEASEALEYVSTLHYELGGWVFATEGIEVSRGTLPTALSLAEVLTWALAIADNRAAQARGSGGSWFSTIISQYYGV
jgi:CRISPR-associated endonuclease Cas3-HD